jgi:hypothetical protein
VLPEIIEESTVGQMSKKLANYLIKLQKNHYGPIILLKPYGKLRFGLPGLFFNFVGEYNSR